MTAAPAAAPTPGTTPNANARKGPQPGQTVGWAVIVDGERVEVRHADIGPRHDRIVRLATAEAWGPGASTSLTRALAEMRDSAGLDLIALVHWFGRFSAGATTDTFAEEAERFPTFDQLERVRFERILHAEADGDEVADDPEA